MWPPAIGETEGTSGSSVQVDWTPYQSPSHSPAKKPPNRAKHKTFCVAKKTITPHKWDPIKVKSKPSTQDLISTIEDQPREQIPDQNQSSKNKNTNLPVFKGKTFVEFKDDEILQSFKEMDTMDTDLSDAGQNDLDPQSKVKWRSYDIIEGVVSYETDFENTRNHIVCEAKQRRVRKAKKRQRRNKLRRQFAYKFLRPRHYVPLEDDPEALEEIRQIEEEFEQRRQEILSHMDFSKAKVTIFQLDEIL